LLHLSPASSQAPRNVVREILNTSLADPHDLLIGTPPKRRCLRDAHLLRRACLHRPAVRVVLGVELPIGAGRAELAMRAAVRRRRLLRSGLRRRDRRILIARREDLVHRARRILELEPLAQRDPEQRARQLDVRVVRVERPATLAIAPIRSLIMRFSGDGIENS
jgi:hypothetical protein